MIRRTSPAGERGSVSNSVSPGESIQRTDNVVERSILHTPRSSQNRPCDACRRRKSRCVLNEGAVKCVLCDFHAQECTFIEKMPSRKRKYTGCEDEVDRWLSIRYRNGCVTDTVLCRPCQDTSRRRLSERSGISKNQDAGVEDYADLKGPTLLKRTLGLQRRHHGLYVGSSGRFERLLTIEGQSVTDTKMLYDTSFRHVSDNDMFVLHPDSGTEMYEHEIEDLDMIENTVTPHGRALIDLYFRIIHPSFPILHKRVYLEKYERSHREFSPALLAAVYILATNYWTYSPELSCSSVPNVALLEKLALKALKYAVHRPKLSTVEAGLLLLQRSSRASWPLTAQMVAVGQDLGLHRDCSEWDIPGWEKGLRKRLGWSLFMQDKWASLVNGRPSHISATDWAVHPLVNQDFPESSADEDDEDGSTEVVKGRSIFTCMTSLTNILSDILSTLYSVAAEEEILRQSSNATTLILTKAKPLQLRLKEWYSGLPESLSIAHVKVRKLSSSGYLHLAYWATEITLHRCIARTLPSCSDLHLVSICHSAALARLKSATDFVKNLKPEHWQSFWYFASEFSFGLIGMFETLVSNCVADTGQYDPTESTTRLDQYRWSLKMASQHTTFLKRSIDMVNLASAEQFVKKRQSVQSGGPGLGGGGGGPLIGHSDRQTMEPNYIDGSLDEDSRSFQWPAAAPASTIEETQTDYEQEVSWGQDAFFDIGLAIDG